MENRLVVFGMNGFFADRQFRPEIVAAVRHPGFDAVIAAPQAARTAAFRISLPGVDFRHVPMERAWLGEMIESLAAPRCPQAHRQPNEEVRRQ